MITFYLLGVIVAAYLASNIFRKEWEGFTKVCMMSGMSVFSWLAVIMLLVHIKLHYKWEIKGLYEDLLKQKALL